MFLLGALSTVADAIGSGAGTGGLNLQLNAGAIAPEAAVLIALLRPAAGAALAWCLARLAGLGEREAAMFLVFGALPPAVMNFLFAERYTQDPARVASIVLIGNLAAVITLPLALAIVL